MTSVLSSRVRRILLALALVLATVIGSAVVAAPAEAGSVADYPDFPYPATDYSEPYRGQFHFSSRSGWMNDVNGPVYYRGVYHLFYQHNPHGLGWATMHWGHATSTDLVHWTQKPIALEPGVHNPFPEGSADDEKDRLFSGSAWVDTTNATGLKTGSDDPILLFYNVFGVSIAYSVDGAKTFQKYNNDQKVITTTDESRDPKVTWDPVTRRWVMVLWANGGGNHGNFYTSTNLLDWTYRGQYRGDWFFECPDLYQLPLDGDRARPKWVLQDASGEYLIGNLNADGVFVPDAGSTVQSMDLGPVGPEQGFYAAQTFNQLPNGRMVQMVWQGMVGGSTWRGNASFPVDLALTTIPGVGARITRNPVPEIATAYSSSQTWGARTITADPASDPFAGMTADTYEIQAQFDLSGATASDLRFKLHGAGEGSRTLIYNVAARTFYGRPLAPINNKVKIRMLIDRGQMEFFGNDGRLSITDQAYFDSTPGNLGLSLTAVGGSVKLDSMSFRRIGSTWGVGESTLQSNAAGPWHAVGGTWTDVTAGKQGSATGDGFYLSSRVGANFSYDGDVRLGTATAAALTFRASANAAGHYTVSLDRSGVIKLWRPGTVIAAVNTPIAVGSSHHLKVVALGPSIKVYLDQGSAPIISATDSTYASGYFGANVFSGTATVQNLDVDVPGFRTNVGGPWAPVGGTWTTTLNGASGNAGGDGFYLSNRTGTDFAYEGDLNIVNGVAAGLTFRADGSGNGYTANIDSSGVVKLWRPGRDIATAAAPIRENKVYHLRVVASGPNLQVFLGGSPTALITATDGTYATGFFGVNVYHGTGVVQNVTVG
jgi:fructan beta-fructosidase